ncbi:MAG: carbohydrate ABC transporter permease [Acholeplasmataceae bacterium]
MRTYSNREERISGFLMVLPAFVMLAIFVITPLGLALYRSFFDYRVGQESAFVGFANYAKILDNDVFFKSFINVLEMTLAITVFQIVCSFLFANALVRIKGKFGVFARTIIYLPYLISGIVVAVIFTLLTTYNGGIINAFLGVFDIEPIPFNNSEFWSPISIIVPTIWIGFGYFSLVMYAGLINIPKSFFEAAEMDGASFFQLTRFITIPMMKNYFLLLIVTLIVANMQMFEVPMIMTNGQPANQTMTPVLYLIHSRANGNISDSEITAAAILIMVLILIVNSFVFKLFSRRGRWEL